MADLQHNDAMLKDKLIGWSLVGASGVRYFLRSLLGEGGQGWVFKANYDVPDGMWVVVKVMRPSTQTDDTIRRFEREASVLKALGARVTPVPNVVRFYDHGSTVFEQNQGGIQTSSELYFTVLEYVEGVTLDELIYRQVGGALSVTRARRLLRQVVRALDTVHALRVVHRDLKPSNILIARSGGQEIVKVTDFGLAKIVDLRLTQTAALVGASLGYAPPEQYEEGNPRVSERTDVFGLAAITFEILAGAAAFPFEDNEHPLRIISRILTGERPSLRAPGLKIATALRGQDDLLRTLDEAINTALDPEPNNRPPSCSSFWQQIEPALREAERRSALNAGAPDVSVSSSDAPTVVRSAERPAPPSTTLAGPASVAAAPMPLHALRPLWRNLHGPMTGLSLRDALFGADQSVLAVGEGGLLRWYQGAWNVLPTPSGIDPNLLRGVQRTPDDKLFLYGDQGTVYTLRSDGAVIPWDTPSVDFSFRGAWLDNPTEAWLVGKDAVGGGIVARVVLGDPSQTQVIRWVSPLTGIIRTARGTLLACGFDGSLLHVQLPSCMPIRNPHQADWFDLEPSPNGGVWVVGRQGLVLDVAPSLQTTSVSSLQIPNDLLRSTTGPDGTQWVCGADGAVAYHHGNAWHQLPVPEFSTMAFCAMGAAGDSVLVLATNGALCEVRLDPSSEHPG